VGRYWQGSDNGSKILKGLKVALRHFVLDFEDPAKDKEPEFRPTK